MLDKNVLYVIKGLHNNRITYLSDEIKRKAYFYAFIKL